MKISALYFFISLLFSASLSGQIVSFLDGSATSDGHDRLVYDASLGNAELLDEDLIYAHLGLVTDNPTGLNWTYVVGNWGQDDGIGKMTRVPGSQSKWEIIFYDGLYDYFGIDSTVTAFRMAAVFRSADGSIKGTAPAGAYEWGIIASNLDYYIDLVTDDFLHLISSGKESIFVPADSYHSVTALASSDLDSLFISVYYQDNPIADTTFLGVSTATITFRVAESGIYQIRAGGKLGNTKLSDTLEINLIAVPPSETLALPDDLLPGINYHKNDPTKATLVLEAPYKDFVYVIGDFNDWTALPEYQMYKTPDGKLFWVEINNLTADQDYVFQYLVDGDIYIGDPYTEQVADPWNDTKIPEDIYPHLPAYTKTNQGMASVLRTGQSEFQWDSSEDNWIRPDENHLVIYELLLRDFVEKHDWQTLTDTLDYFGSLGIDAIEVMPFNEFEGNSSWGYNPAYYFAPDKYYGPKEDIKKFVQEAHKRGIAVIMDVVLNHAYGQNPMVKLYFDHQTNTPAADNPWFNRDYVGPYQWGYDWNHESEATERFVDRFCDHWLREYHLDGFRFDFTKGMTNQEINGSIEAYDPSRIAILDRMGKAIQNNHPGAYMILEHWSTPREESELADLGFKMWSNRSYDYVPAALGTPRSPIRDMERTSHVQYYNSHDENRLPEHILSEGHKKDDYDTREYPIMYERAKQIAAFTFLHPGPKMMWQFDEVAYDIDINFDGRLGEKPLPWGDGSLDYYSDEGRLKIKEVFSALMALRNNIKPQKLATAKTNHKYHTVTPVYKYDTDSIDLILFGNFGLTTRSVTVDLSGSDSWYDYFFTDSISAATTEYTVELSPGEWHVFTSQKMPGQSMGLVSVFENPFTVSPTSFTLEDELNITFDLNKATIKGNAESFLSDEEIYLVTSLSTDNSFLESTTRMISMSPVSDNPNMWMVSLTPGTFFDIVEDTEYSEIGMFVTSKDGMAEAYGFLGDTVFFDFSTGVDMVTVSPGTWDSTDEITIRFDASQGFGELRGADKVYVHSSAFTEDTSPLSQGWNYVVGNWGQDDGVGEMTKVEGEQDMWEIVLTPKEYYNLGDKPSHWLGLVFRNADGSKKGTQSPGEFTQGFVHTNFDVFIQNGKVTSNTSLWDVSFSLYPSPTRHNFKVVTPDKQRPDLLRLIDLNGRTVWSSEASTSNEYKLPDLVNGVYRLVLYKDSKMTSLPLVISH